VPMPKLPDISKDNIIFSNDVIISCIGLFVKT
jgi:hypothetical protein